MAKKEQKTEAKKVKQKITSVDCFHLDKATYANKSATAVLTKVADIAEAYSFNKHKKKELKQVSLRVTDFQKLVSSVNAALNHEKKNGIATSHLIYEGINIVPTQIAV